jgi:hypothetical protein
MNEQDWQEVKALFNTAHNAGLSLFAFVTVPVNPAALGELADAALETAHDAQETEQVPSAHLVWAATPREARLMVCFPGGHFINEITGAALVSFESKDILDARNSEDIAMLAANLQSMLSQAQLHD